MIQRRLATGLPPRFRRLITQRTEPLTPGAAIDLPVLKSQEALELLKIRAGEHGGQRIEREQQAALALVADVEGLPLALSLAALRRDLARPELSAEAFKPGKCRAAGGAEPGGHPVGELGHPL